ncbi:hypothetical protein Patl1_32193 [Pistacia atlantica]|uniref:Uncharacterized protein n=1 Tax=Pistacia atlantica TaxID=434234 RepID=A0ACC1AQ71_9ROSI|nr:hypothetical protein Patl1_32193 [Pistacia atlantica]
MASLFLSSTFLAFPSSHKLFLSLHHNHHRLSFNNFQQYPLRKHFTYRLYASSLNKTSRSRRKLKSNEELRNDLREFLSRVGLPNDHVPTMKELSEHGRNDLANIVRRRGYKFVRELLANSTKIDCDGLIAEKGLPGQNEKVGNEAEDFLLLVEEPSLRNYFGSTNTESNLNSDDNSGLPIESSADSSLEENHSYAYNGQNDTESNRSVMNNLSGGSFSNTDLICDEIGLLPLESSSSLGLEEKASTSYNIERQHEKKNIAENISSSNDVSTMETYFSSSNVEPSPNFVEHHYTSPEASTTITLEGEVSSSNDVCIVESYSSSSNVEPSLNFVEHHYMSPEASATITMEEEVSSSNDVSIVESYSSSSNIEPSPNFVENHYTSPEASATITLEEKVSSSNDVSILESYPSSSNVELSPNFVEYHYTSPEASESNDVSIVESYPSSSNIKPFPNLVEHHYTSSEASTSNDVSIIDSYPSSSNIKPFPNFVEHHYTSAQASASITLEEKVSSSNDVFIVESYPSSSNVESSSNFVEHHYTAPEASAPLTLEEKVANFIQNGDLDMIDDDVYDILDESDAKESEEVTEGGNKSGIPGPDLLERVYNHRADGAVTLNGSALTSNKLTSSATVNHPLRDDGLAAEGLINVDFDKDLDIETSRIENQLEINNLKSMLQQMELELSRLKDQIEKEQRALCVLQTKAETEISKAQKLISEKDAELNAVEESLSGLEEVEIQYSGDGEIVEVAGSFNGWHHRIKMDPKPSSSIIETIGSRKSRTWSTVLWLYPGMYEIKFIVDGEWKNDPKRESVTRGGILNNILRVDR